MLCDRCCVELCDRCCIRVVDAVIGGAVAGALLLVIAVVLLAIFFIWKWIRRRKGITLRNGNMVKHGLPSGRLVTSRLVLPSLISYFLCLVSQAWRGWMEEGCHRPLNYMVIKVREHHLYLYHHSSHCHHLSHKGEVRIVIYALVFEV